MKQQNILSAALRDFNKIDSSNALKLFTSYYQELLIWNKKINLISRKNEDQIVTRHFLESMGFIKAIDFPCQARVMDLGSGAGLPGIPIAIIRPDLNLLLVEAKKKKVEFLRNISRKLGLKNIQIINKRVEEIDDEIKPMDVIVCRSVASLSKLYKWSHRCLKPSHGRLITIKGEQYHRELHLLLKQAGSDTKIEYKIEPYNPFPGFYSIRKCYLVIIKVGQIK
ncbi:MAG: 16S rRNA (guanine(527)-N(7))-methyltransferase RsmG [bacterium]